MTSIEHLLNPRPEDEFDALLLRMNKSRQEKSSGPTHIDLLPEREQQTTRTGKLIPVDWNKAHKPIEDTDGAELECDLVTRQHSYSRSGPGSSPARSHNLATIEVVGPPSTSRAATRLDSFPMTQNDASSRFQELHPHIVHPSTSIPPSSYTIRHELPEDSSRPEDLEYPSLPFAMTNFQPSERASTRLAARSSTATTIARKSIPLDYSSTSNEAPYSRSTTASSPAASHKKRRTESDSSSTEQPAPKRTKSSKPQSNSSLNARRSTTVKRSGSNGTTTVQWKFKGNVERNAIPELQQARCMSARYKTESASKCISCTRRWAGDTCRFQLLRLFMRDKESGETLGVCFTQHLEVTPHPMHYPSKWNVELQKHHVMSIKRTVAKALLPVLVDELGHLTSENHGPDGVVVRARETEVRATCDTCLTSLFSRSWMCRRCGREQCADCYTTLKEHTFIDRNATREQRLEHDAKRERHAQTNPSFFTCCRKDDHDWSYFFPVSRFTNQELVDAINSMRRLIDGESAQSGVEVLSLAHSPEFSGSANSSASSSAGPPTPPDTLSCLPSVLPNSLVIGGPPHPRNSLDKGDIPSWELAIFPHQSLTEEVFRPMWARGEPFAVTGLLQKLKLPWTPEHFIEAYGDQSCLIIECQEDTNKRTTVREFFSEFGKYHGRKECWKLKDWPPMSDFKSSFPTLYDDFSQAVPMPDYVRRDGVLNVASYFPLNTIAPDLGPKMYNAMASNTTVGSKGSTRLHMDMADAVNIMTYAAHKPDGSEGCAAWDLFRAQDSDKIRTFLRSKVRSPNGGPPQDPIHSQQIYLDDHLRLELFRIHGVKSFRFYQRPGEAVFIPAGCAHQVSNLADSVKIAIDFVSPENIARCEQLTREFREQNHSQAWKEDVLQLRSMMWFAWQACCKHEGQESAVTSESNVES